MAAPADDAGAGGGIASLLALSPSAKAGPSKGGGSPVIAPEDATEENAFDETRKDGIDEALVGAGHDILSAMRSRDPEGFAVALKDFISMV